MVGYGCIYHVNVYKLFNALNFLILSNVSSISFKGFELFLSLSFGLVCFAMVTTYWAGVNLWVYI